MDSPIIILVFWVIINILLKSSRDKKKAEQARRKSGQGSVQNRQQPKGDRSRMNTGRKDFRQALEDYKSQIENELNPDRKTPVKPKVSESRQKVERPDSRLEKSKMRTFREGRYWEDATEDVIETASGKEVKESAAAAEKEAGKAEKSPEGIFDIKNDILKGIVYSEILGKPKSMQTKRGPF